MHLIGQSFHVFVNVDILGLTVIWLFFLTLQVNTCKPVTARMKNSIIIIM